MKTFIKKVLPLKRTVILALLLCLTVTLFGCDKAENGTTVSGTHKKTNEDYMKIYAQTLDTFYDNIANEWEGYEYNDGNDLGNASYMWFQYEIDLGTSGAGYALIDIDKNGVPELLISPVEYAMQDGFIFDLFTIDDGEVIHLASSGERSRYYLSDENSVLFEGSSSALESYYYNYVINKAGNSLKTNRVLIYDGYENSKKPWFYGKTEPEYTKDGLDYSKLENITEDEADAVIFPSKKPFEVITFSQYKER